MNYLRFGMETENWTIFIKARFNLISETAPLLLGFKTFLQNSNFAYQYNVFVERHVECVALIERK